MKEGSGISLAIAIGCVTCFVLMPPLLVVLIYLMITAMAGARAFGIGEQAGMATGVLVGIVAIVGTLTTLLAVGMGKIGASLTPKKADRGSS